MFRKLLTFAFVGSPTASSGIWGIFPIILTSIILLNVHGNSIAMAGMDGSLPDLLRKYAPVLYFHPEEKVYPWGINSMLDNADLKRLQDSQEIPMPVGSEDLASNNNDKCYLDLRNVTPYNDGAKVSSDLGKMFEGFPFTVYGRLVEPQETPTHVVLQYWFFYPYNDWYNEHEGDWEMVQIHYSKDRRSPDQLTTSHHHSGTVMAWNEVSKIEGTHPKIFVAKGSHGNWPTSGNHIVGRIWVEVPIFRDETSENGLALYPEYVIDKVEGRKQKYILEDISDESLSSWIYWNGKWGDVELLVWGSKGPESPGVQDKWKDPIEWGNKPARSSFWIYFGSPGYMHIYDSHGNHVGLKKRATGEMEANIPGTYFYVSASDEVPQDCVWINTSEAIRFEIVATASGTFNLSFDLDLALAGRDEEKIPVTVEYKNVQIAKGGVAKVNVEVEKLADRIKASSAEKPAKKKASGEMNAKRTELEELEDIIKAHSVGKPAKKKIADKMEAELAELESMIKASSIERSSKKKASDAVSIELAELELENMIEVARLSRKLVKKKGIDRVNEELAELEDTIEGDNLLERLLKPILIMKIDLDADGIVDKVQQPDRISQPEL